MRIRIRHEGAIDILGTRRGHRKQGLGRALLLAGLHRLRAAGLDTATIAVDAAIVGNIVRTDRNRLGRHFGLGASLASAMTFQDVRAICRKAQVDRRHHVASELNAANGGHCAS